jgi:hypothetical protein
MQNVLSLQLFETPEFDTSCVSSYSGCPSNVSYVKTAATQVA